MEKTWSTFILPVGEAQSAKSPHPRIEGGDYSFFSKYEIHEDGANEKLARKIQCWRQTYHVDAGAEIFRLGNWNKLVSEDRTFAESKSSLGFQLADIAATSLRRAFNGKLRKEGWERFGKIMVHRKTPNMRNR